MFSPILLNKIYLIISFKNIQTKDGTLGLIFDLVPHSPRPSKIYGFQTGSSPYGKGKKCKPHLGKFRRSGVHVVFNAPENSKTERRGLNFVDPEK